MKWVVEIGHDKICYQSRITIGTQVVVYFITKSTHPEGVQLVLSKPLQEAEYE